MANPIDSSISSKENTYLNISGLQAFYDRLNLNISSDNMTIAESLNNLNTRIKTIEELAYPTTFTSLYANNMSTDLLIAKNVSGVGTASFTAKSALSAGSAATANYARTVAAHQLSSHTNWSTYFSGTSARSANYAGSALSAGKDGSGRIITATYETLSANSAYNKTIANALDDLNSRLLSIENSPYPSTFTSIYANNMSTDMLIAKNVSGVGTASFTAKSALSAGSASTAYYARTVSAHQLSSHTNWSTYFTGTSAKYAVSATNAYNLQGKTSADFYPMNTNPNEYLTSSTLMDVNWQLEDYPGLTFSLSSITNSVQLQNIQINYTLIPRTNYILDEMSGKLDTSDAWRYSTNNEASAYMDYGSMSAAIIAVAQNAVDISHLSAMILEISGKLPS